MHPQLLGEAVLRLYEEGVVGRFVELFGGVLLIVGLFTRVAGLLLAGEMAVAIWRVHMGKGVLAVPEIPRGQARRELMLRYGDLVESLHGTYITACDKPADPPTCHTIGF